MIDQKYAPQETILEYGVYDCPEVLIAESPTASMLELRLKALIAQEERDMISARTKAALTARKARDAVSNGTVGRKIHEEKAAAATKDAIIRGKKLQSQGYSYQKIADVLNVEGFTTSTGGAWHKQSIDRWLNKK